MLTELRFREVKFPSDAVMLSDEQRSLIRWLLNHEPEKRPTSAELLQSHYLPPPQVVIILSSYTIGKQFKIYIFSKSAFFLPMLLPPSFITRRQEDESKKGSSHFGQNLMRNLTGHSCKFDSILHFFLQKPRYLFVIKC